MLKTREATIFAAIPQKFHNFSIFQLKRFEKESRPLRHISASLSPLMGANHRAHQGVSIPIGCSMAESVADNPRSITSI